MRDELPYGDFATALYNERRQRERLLGPWSLSVADPAWDMLLLLYITQASGRPLAVKAICTAGSTLFGTGLRHLAALERSGLIHRAEDPLDRRRGWVRFTPAGLTTMRLHLEDTEQKLVDHARRGPSVRHEA